MLLEFDIDKSLRDAIRFFWNCRNSQSNQSVDASNRGSVLGGKQMDGFIRMLKNACKAVGVPEECVHTRNNYIPGFFRASKNWGFMIISPSGKLLVLIELKSQIGSYGNNFNNRTEEAIGNATDLWTSYREHEFPASGNPWIGYLMVVGDDSQSRHIVKNPKGPYPVMSEFENTSYTDRYRLLCERLVTERLYTSTCLISTAPDGSCGDVSAELSLEGFINSLQGYLIGKRNEYNS